MGWLSRREQTSRDYPHAPATFTGDAGRFRRSKTAGARQAGAAAEAWEQADRRRDRQGTSVWRWR